MHRPPEPDSAASNGDVRRLHFIYIIKISFRAASKIVIRDLETECKEDDLRGVKAVCEWNVGKAKSESVWMCGTVCRLINKAISSEGNVSY